MSEGEVVSEEPTDEELGVVRSETDLDAGSIPQIVWVLVAVALIVPLVFGFRRKTGDSDEGAAS